jgi:hypothetical protein
MGGYMYNFQYLSQACCVNATCKTKCLGRLMNHSKCGKGQTKLHDIYGVPQLNLIVPRDVAGRSSSTTKTTSARLHQSLPIVKHF